MESVPSGSAIRAAGDGSFWIISDDAPFFYRVSPAGDVLDSLPLTHFNTALHRIPKAEKPDFEAAVRVQFDEQPWILAFGSGSHDTRRDSILIARLGSETQHIYSLTPFYERIRQTVGIAARDFNIEGAAHEGERIVLFNRGTGHLIYFSWVNFLRELTEAKPINLPITSGRLELPSTDSFPPGLSGGAFLDDQRLLFCASAEATTDWYADGEVLGSFIGIADLSNPAKPRLVCFSPLLGADGAPVKDKLEGIDLVREAGGTVYEVVGVVDNDDGTSKLLHIRVDGL